MLVPPPQRMRVSGSGKQFIVDNCVIQGTGWALLGALSGADLVVRNNTRLTGNGANSAIYVSGATVKTHITHILAKLSLRDRVQAVIVAYETGLVEPGAATVATRGS